MNLLDNISTNYIDFAVEKITTVDLNWIGKIIQWLIEGIGIIGIGVIVFTLILKTIVLPLDIYSRVKTKKQALVMEQMRPQMEKLQKQYENDKQMYSQKVMELQKKSGYSMFAACIPMIVSLVIFMVVFSAFSTYSQFANLTTYNNMVDEYNGSVQTYVLADVNEKTVNTDGFLIECNDESVGGISYLVDFEKFVAKYNESAAEKLDDSFYALKEADKMVTVRNYVRENARAASAEYYLANKSGFLWVKNIWYPDSMLNKEMPSFSKFSSSISRAVGATIDDSYELSYDEVTYNLSTEKSTYNGYFVLIILAIGIMFLQQFIMMRSQKATNELSSVDGSAARTTKWMTVLMPIMYGIFSFFYSAAFSIYMITNTLYGLITTLIINKVMNVKFAGRDLLAEGQAKVQKKQGKNNNNRKRLK